MSAGDFLVNNWANSTLPWGVTYPNWDNINIITTTGITTGVTTTPNITVYPQPSIEIGTQMEIDWEAIRRSLEIPGYLINTIPLTATEAELQQLGMRRLELEEVPVIPVPKKVVPRKPLRMIRLREDAKVS